MGISAQIRLAERTDGPALVPLMQALYAHDMPDVAAPDETTVRTHIAQLLAAETPHLLAVAFSPDGRALGLAAFALFVSVSDPRPERWRQVELKELFVLPEARSAGLGTALMDWVEAEARAAGACRMDWHVKADNHRGIAFYRRFGASLVGNRRSMRKTLMRDGG